MKHLHGGNQSPERLALLLKLTSIRSEDVIGALEDHLVKGHPAETAAAFNGIPPANVTRAMDKLEQVADIIEQIKDIDWRR